MKKKVIRGRRETARPGRAASKSSRRPNFGPKSRSAGTAALAGISSVAVEQATGRTWADWLVIIDRGGGPQLSHAQIAQMLSDQGVPDWWSQMVTVGYEQARGRREKHQKPGGYEISVSRTISASVREAFDAWTSEARRSNWLPEAFEIRTVTPMKYVRGPWADGQTYLNVNFTAKGSAKCQVTAQHAKIRSAAKAETLKKFWTRRLEALKSHLES